MFGISSAPELLFDELDLLSHSGSLVWSVSKMTVHLTEWKGERVGYKETTARLVHRLRLADLIEGLRTKQVKK